MLIQNASASLAVQDLDAAATWYTRLLGLPHRPLPEVMEWRFEQGGGLQVYLGPERAGRGSATLHVRDVVAVADLLRKRGLAPDASVVRGEVVDTVMVRDPDGNSIAFAGPLGAT